MEEHLEEEEELRSITIIIHCSEKDCPIIDYYAEENYIPVQFVEFTPHFWCFQLEDIKKDDDNFQLCLSPSLGPSELIDLNFTETQPFVFYDLTKDKGLVPFIEFHEFFTHSIASHFLTFEFDTQDPIKSISRFISAFDEDYFIWALAFVSTQPWRALFIYNEDFSKLLLDILIPFLETNFYIQDDRNNNENQFTDFYCLPVDTQNKPKTQLHPTKKYESLGKFADVMMLMVQNQVGESLSYLLSAVIDFNQDFPFTPYVPPFYSNKKKFVKETEELITKLIARYSKLDQDQLTVAFQRLTYALISIYNEQFTISLKPLFDLNSPDLALVDLIIKVRMYESQRVCKEALQALQTQLHDSIESSKTTEIASAEAIVPPEWLNAFLDVFSVAPETRRQIVQGSIKCSVPRHISDHFFFVTESGALIMGSAPDTILQPGCIVQPHATLLENTMMMTQSIATEESTLAANSYVPPDSIVVSRNTSEFDQSTKNERPFKIGRGGSQNTSTIDPSAKIERPVKIGRGVSIHKDVVICANATIEHGCVIFDGAVIGSGAVISTGCVIEPGEIVPPHTKIPMGFSYSQALVEDCAKIPKVVSTRGTRFTKESSCFDLDTLMQIEGVDIDCLMKSYFEMMHDFPRECGRELAAHREKLPFSEFASKNIVLIFDKKALSLGLSYWEAAKEETEAGKQWDKCIKGAVAMAISEFELSIEEFESQNTAQFIEFLCENLNVFSDKGIGADLISELKKDIFETCDELLVRLQLIKNAKESKLHILLNRIIELTKN